MGRPPTSGQTIWPSRNLGDYSTDPFERETAEDLLRDTGEFLDAVEVYLEGAV